MGQSESLGVICLVGGEEFRGAAEAVDRLLLRQVSESRPAVAVLPTAAAGSQPEMAASNGVRHFEGLGASAYAVMVVDRSTADEASMVEELGRADVVYLAGGSPGHLVESLHGSAVWARMVELYERGVAIAGSSAGAMALCDRMMFEDRTSAGLGLLEGVTVLPHFERRGADGIDGLQAGLDEGAVLLGIDGSTGCVRVGGEWRVEGPGAVTVISREGIERVTAGGSFSLE